MLQRLLLSRFAWRTHSELTKAPSIQGFWGKSFGFGSGSLPAKGSDMVLCAEHPKGARGCTRLCPCTSQQLGTSSVCGLDFCPCYLIPLPLV